MSKVYCYIRTSTNKQDTSLEVQREALENYCNRHNFTNVEYLVESDVSGGVSLFKRPQGSKLENLESGDYVIFTKHDRAARSVENGIRIVKKWYYSGVSIVFLNISEQPINISNPAAKFSFFVMLCAAELEKDMIGQRTREGLRNRRANGQTNSRERYGFTNISKGVSGKEVVNHKEVEILRLMNNLRESGLSYAKIANHLNNEKIYTKKGTKWNHGNIPPMIENFKEMIKKGLI